MRDVEEALARQVLYGGDLATNLLELAAVREPELTELLAESHELQPAPAGELPKAEDAILRLVPGDLAKRHGFYPLGEADGILVIAVSEPLAIEVEQDLTFSLGSRLEQRAAPLVRILQAVSRDYALPMDRRTLRLVAKLEGRPDPSPSSLPAASRESLAVPALPRPPSLPPLPYPQTLITPRDAGDASRERPSPAVQVARQLSPTATQVETLISPRTALRQAPPVASTPSPQPLASPTPPETIGASPRGGRRARGRRRHRGPYTAAMAEADLNEAETRDDVLGAFFDFATQYFEYTALFALHADLAEGRDADGPGADRERIRAIGVPLDLPSVLSNARDSRTWQLARLAEDGLDQSLARDLGRKVGQQAFLLPVLVRNRPVLVLYGDHGSQDVSLDEVGPVLAFASLVAGALERVILRRKGGAPDAVTPFVPRVRERVRHALPVPEARAEALVRALEPPAASQSPSTVSATPAALGRALLEPAPVTVGPFHAAPPATVAATPAARSGERDAPSTQSASPQARADAGKVTPREIPGRKVVRARKRVSTPPQGSPTLDPEQQPFPLTRRTPSQQPPSDDQLPPDSGWDIWENEPRTARGIGASKKPPEYEAPELEIVPGDAEDEDWELDEPAERGRARRDTGTAVTAEMGLHEVPLAPSSRKVSFGPRRPRPAHDSPNLRLPSVIVDLEADCISLVQRLVSGDDRASDQLVEIGEPAVLVLVARFPGPVRSELAQRVGEPGARASECGPILRTLARVPHWAAPYLVVRTADGNPNTRKFATWLLGEMPSSETARAVVRRAVDEDAEVRRAAIAAGRMMAADVDARTALRDGLATLAAAPEQPEATRQAAVEALANMRDGRAVPRLIPLLSDAAMAKSVAWALGVLTRQEFGRDAKAWSRWWAEHSSAHRMEWLMDSLMHPSKDVRRAAGEELKLLTKEYYGYYEDLPEAERARAQARYREWWEQRGKVRFF